jgi:hypothetical protein
VEAGAGGLLADVAAGAGVSDARPSILACMVAGMPTLCDDMMLMMG